MCLRIAGYMPDIPDLMPKPIGAGAKVNDYSPHKEFAASGADRMAVANPPKIKAGSRHMWRKRDDETAD